MTNGLFARDHEAMLLGERVLVRGAAFGEIQEVILVDRRQRRLSLGLRPHAVRQ